MFLYSCTPPANPDEPWRYHGEGILKFSGMMTYHPGYMVCFGLGAEAGQTKE